MAKASLEVVVDHIRKMVDAQTLAEATDAQLVERFVRSHEERAFATLLRRHAPMVFSVCRGVLQQREDAEDVFQATFLLLVRKVDSIRKRASVASWLHGVAYRLAVRAKAQKRLRRSQEIKAAAMRRSNSRVEEAWRELRPVLDEEIENLPEKYRTALVLCYLEGKTQQEAARQLACPLGTVRSRVGRARKLLQERLTRRGLAFSTGSFTAFLVAGAAPAMLRAQVPVSTLKACLQFATARPAAAFVSAPVAALVEGGLRATLSTQWKMMAALLLAASLVAGVGALAHELLEAKPSDRKQDLEPQPAAKRAEMPDPTKACTDRYGDPLPAGAIARLGTVRFRHGYAATSVAFSPDGKTVASGELGNWVYLWDVATGKELGRFGSGPTPHPGLEGIHAIAFSPDGRKILAGGSGAPAIVLWDVATGKELLTLQGHQGPVFSVAYSPDNQTVASAGGDTTVRLWDTRSGQELRQLAGHEGWVRCVAFSPDGTVLASCGETIRLWDVATGKELRRCGGHRFEVNTVAFSPDGKVLASGSDDKTIRFWDVASGKEWRQLHGQLLFVLAVAFGPDGQRLASAEVDGTIRLWETATGKQVRAFEGHDGPVASVAFSPDGKLLASAGGDKVNRAVNRGGDKIVRLWDVATGKGLRPGGGHQHTLSSAAFSADGRTVATGSQDGTVRLWDAATGEELYRYHNTAQPIVPKKANANSTGEEAGQPVQAVAFSPDGKTFAWAGRRICLCDRATRQEIRRLGKEGDQVLCIAFSPDGKILAAGNRVGWLRLFAVTTGQELKLLGGGYGGITCLCFSPDGRAIVLAHERSAAITVWEIATGNRLLHLRVGQDFRVAVNSVAYSPDGRRLATGLSAMNTRALVDNLYLWDAHTGRGLGKLQGQFGQIAAVAFSPDGRTLASASGDRAFFGGSDRTIRLWELATGEERRCFQGHQSGISSLAFAPDGKSLVSAGEDSTALVWDITGLRGTRRSQDLPVTVRDIESKWGELAKADAAHAHSIMWLLAASPQQTVTFFKDHLHPASPADPKRVDELLAELASDHFAVRQRATQELEKLADMVEATLRQKLQEKLTLEMRQRVERLLLKAEPSGSPERLREVRAIEILEHIGTPQAKQLLQRLATGAREARLTQEAKASLERLSTRVAAYNLLPILNGPQFPRLLPDAICSRERFGGDPSRTLTQATGQMRDAPRCAASVAATFQGSTPKSCTSDNQLGVLPC